MCMCATTHTWKSVDSLWVSSLLPPRESQGLKSGHQAWHQVAQLMIRLAYPGLLFWDSASCHSYWPQTDVAKVGLETLILLPRPSECWDWWHALSNNLISKENCLHIQRKQMRLNITISDSWFRRDSISLSFNLYIWKEVHISDNPSKAIVYEPAK